MINMTISAAYEAITNIPSFAMLSMLLVAIVFVIIVIFAAFLGIAFLGVKRKQPEHAATFSGIVDAVYAIIKNNDSDGGSRSGPREIKKRISRQKLNDLLRQRFGIVDAVYAIIMRVVTLILRLTPYGVLAIMTKTIATSNIDSIAKLGMFVIASYAEFR
jgi:L-cystine uptake protein TcyP (sodium:dicarboxylate symporter family)